MGEDMPATVSGQKRALGFRRSPSPSASRSGRSSRSSACRIKQDLGLSETEFGLLVGLPILTGSLSPHLPRHLDRPVWRARRLHPDDARGGRRHLSALLRHDLSVDAGRRARRRPGRRLLRGRHRLRLQVVSAGEAGHGARHLRRRQCRRGGHQVRRALRARRLRLADGGGGLGVGPRGHRRSSSSSTSQDDPEIRRAGAPGARSRARRCCNSSRSATSRSGGSRSTTSSSSAASSRWRCGCRTT